MYSVLVVGNPGHPLPFLDPVPADHHLYPIDAAALADAGADALAGLDLPEKVDMVVDLVIDRALKKRALAALAGVLGSETILFTNVLTMTATDVASRLAASPTVVGISYVPHLVKTSPLLEAAPALGTAPEKARRAIEMLGAMTSKEVEMVGDRVALVSARTLAMIVNEGAFALMEGVAGAGDIDVAMKLGTNYPEGPLRWADQIGPDIILHILQALHDEYQEERYRPCVLLKQLVRAGQALSEG